VKEIRLGKWDECLGIFESLEITEADVVVVLSCGAEKLRLLVDGAWAEIVEKLYACKLGTRIAILKTDEPLRPFLLHTL